MIIVHIGIAETYNCTIVRASIYNIYVYIYRERRTRSKKISHTCNLKKGTLSASYIAPNTPVCNNQCIASKVHKYANTILIGS